MAEPDVSGAGSYGLIGGSGPTNTRSGSGSSIGGSGGGTSNVARIGAKISIDNMVSLVGEVTKLRDRLKEVRKELESINGLSSDAGLTSAGSSGRLGSMVKGFTNLGERSTERAGTLAPGALETTTAAASSAGPSATSQRLSAMAAGPTSPWPGGDGGGGGMGFGSMLAASMFPGGSVKVAMAKLAVMATPIAYNTIQDRTKRNMAQSAGISSADTLSASIYGFSRYEGMEMERLDTLGRYSGSRESALGAFNTGQTFGLGYEANMDYMGEVARMVQASGGTMTSGQAAQQGGLFLDPAVMRMGIHRGITPVRHRGEMRNPNQVALDYLRNYERTLGMGEQLNEAALLNLSAPGSASRRSMMNFYGLGHEQMDVIAKVGLQNFQFREEEDRDIDFSSEEDLRRFGFDSNKFGLQSTALESVEAMREGRFFRNQEDSFNRRMGTEMTLQDTLSDVENAFGGVIGKLLEFERVIQGITLAVGLAGGARMMGGMAGMMMGRGGAAAGAGRLMGGAMGMRGAAGAAGAAMAPVVSTGGAAAAAGPAAAASGAARFAGLRTLGGAGLLIGSGMMAHNADSGGDVAGAIGMGAAGGAMLGSVLPGPGTAVGAVVGGVAGGAYAAVNYFRGLGAEDVEEGYVNALGMPDDELIESFDNYHNGLAGGGGSAGPRERGRYDAWQARRGALVAAFLAAGYENAAQEAGSPSEAKNIAETAGSLAGFFSDPNAVRNDMSWKMRTPAARGLIDTIKRTSGGDKLYERYFDINDPFALQPVNTEEARSLVMSSPEQEQRFWDEAFESGLRDNTGDGEFDNNPWSGSDQQVSDWAAKSASFAGLDQTLESRLKRLFDAAGGNLWLGQGYRSPEAQEQMFLDRHVEDPNGDISWNGKKWKRVRGAPAAPPGRSMHEIGLAADLVGPAVDNGWLRENAGRFGLKTFDDVNDEPWHVQLEELPNSRAQYEKEGGAGAADLSDRGIPDGHSETGAPGGGGGVGGRLAGISGVRFSIVDQLKKTASGGPSGWAGTGASTTAGDTSPGSISSDGPMSAEDVARLAHAAGFRGQDLVDVVAIAGRESGYDPGAFNPDRSTGDQSYGLMQINMIDELGPARRAALGIENNEELYDPWINMQAAYQLYEESGNTLRPWGGYKGRSNTYDTNLDAAQQAVIGAGFGGDGEFVASSPSPSSGGHSGPLVQFGDITITGVANGREAADQFVAQVSPKLEQMAGMLTKRSS